MPMAHDGEPMRVDAHQHFWRYSRDEFDWISEPMAAIRRDFLPGDLLPLLDQAEVDATVTVQVGQSLAETNWLLDLAEENDWIAGVVGWVPLADPQVEKVLEHLSQNVKLKGVRHILQAEPDAYMDHEDFNAGLTHLRRYSLVYDVLVYERQLPTAIRLVDRHPVQPMVLDHLAKPPIARGELEPWRTHIRELARRPQVSCKLSGMVTEASFDSWTIEDLRPYVETVLDAFGPERLLFGSDWPVCTVAASYGSWAGVVRDFTASLSIDEQNAIWGGNATKIYQLDNINSSQEVARA